MCGIWGVFSIDKLLNEKTKRIIHSLFRYSERRGRDASGIVGRKDERYLVYKSSLRASRFIKEHTVEELLNDTLPSSVKCFIGHTRLSTNGDAKNNLNNQPVFDKETITVHNGIIVNTEFLCDSNSNLTKISELDTEIFVRVLEKELHTKNPCEAISAVYKQIKGTASTISIFPRYASVIAATNNGSLYYVFSHNKQSILIASESRILERTLRNSGLSNTFDTYSIHHLEPNHLCSIDMATMAMNVRKIQDNVRLQYQKSFDFCIVDLSKYPMCSASIKKTYLSTNCYSKYEIDIEPIKKLRRCTRCILPETMPGITFDTHGVCNYCRTYRKYSCKGRDALHAWIRSLRANRYGNDCLVTLSGGRDSCYALHYIVKELGLHPVAFSYDWGMVTDLARRNQSRLCSKLGIELITISADIRKKRENIRKNMCAWLRAPDLGMVPLLMAGDKTYFWHAYHCRKELGLEQVVVASNPFEKTQFKALFANAKNDATFQVKSNNSHFEQMPLASVFSMAIYYLKRYFHNSSYFNSSVFDVIKGVLGFYFLPHRDFRLYDYIPWEESKVENVLLNEYDFELAKDAQTTWRIGDGTAPFYNYVYYIAAGFTENDTFRSHQVREGYLPRDEALSLAFRDNQPRFSSMEEYFKDIGVSMEDALSAVQKLPKLYNKE